MSHHPSFCPNYGSDVDCDVHQSWPVHGTATAGGTTATFTLAAVQLADGTPAVRLTIGDADLFLTDGEVQALANAIDEMADKAAGRR